MDDWIVSWLLLAMSTISIFSDITRASASAQCPGVNQRLPLLELRNSLVFNASQSSKLVQWDRNVSSWSGVTCEDGLVIGLDLSDESISGGLNDSWSLFGLEFLQRLNLAFNDFNYAAIPSGLANLNRLVYLNLSNARFAGQIPAELSRLRELRTLDLTSLFFDRAFLELKKPNLRALIGDMGELRELYLDFVNVSAEGSAWCDVLSSSVSKLEVLSMSFCSLSGPIDASLTSLANLLVIQLSGNNLSTTVPRFLASFSSLKTLSLGLCGLYGEFPGEVFWIPTLQTLDISFNMLLQGSLPEFPAHSSLENLLLSGTNISGTLPVSISNLKKLSRIELANCSFTGTIPISIVKLPLLALLDFSMNQFSGPVPPLGASRNLTRITLSHNALTGQIASIGWEDLLNLVYLDLRDNLFEGNIPSCLFTLTRLKTIQLSNNRFSGQLIIYPNVSSYQLGILDLGGNQLQGPIPASIFELQGLSRLSLFSNNFSGLINIDAFWSLGNLAYLDLSYNGMSINAMTSAYAAATSVPDLYTLKLASCKLWTLPQFLANQSKLVILDLSHNYIQGEIPRWIWELKNLMHLNFSSNFFEDLGTLPDNLTSTLTVLDLHSNMLLGNTLPLPPLASYLDFSNNSIDAAIPDDIGNYLSVTIFFSLSKNNFHGSIPRSICKAFYLEVLDLSHNDLIGTIPDLFIMESLKVLNLRNNRLSGDISQNIPRTCGLKTLDFSENLLQGQIPMSLANCATLEYVNLGDNLIDGTFPCHFQAASFLRVLVLRSNKLHGEIGCPRSTDTWQMLQVIDLSSNNFSGALPTSLLTSWEAMKVNVSFNHLQYDFLPFSGLNYQDTMRVTFKGLQLELVKILTVFTLIDFSSNRLEGPLPDILGDLRALYVLNLSHNAILGSIPPALGNLGRLESLDLSRNYLNGIIPAQLANLNFLSFLNLSNNQLVGSIPTSGQFLTFSESSFEGNFGLCGSQLNKNCSITTNGTGEASDDDDNDDSRKKWFYMGIPFGFAVGFWVFCGPLVFMQSWRYAYYRFWDKVLFKISRPRRFPQRFGCKT